jgi:hypothetical protein
MPTRRHFGITLATAAASLPVSRVLAQAGHNPAPADEPTEPASPEPVPAGWVAEPIALPPIDGFPYLLSPTGTHIAGHDHDLRPRIWDFATGESVALGKGTVAGYGTPWGAWAPDGSALAWASNGNPNGDRIGVLELTSGRQHFIEDDVTSANAPLFNDGQPVWSIDNQSVAFVRTVVEYPVSSIMSARRDGSEIGLLARGVAEGTSVVSGNLHRLADDSIVYAVTWDPQTAATFYPGIWHLPVDGEPVQLLPGGSGNEHVNPVVLDAALLDDTVAVMATGIDELENVTSFLLGAPASDPTTPVIREIQDFELLDALDAQVTLAAFSPDGFGLLTLTARPAGLEVGVLDSWNETWSPLHTIPGAVITALARNPYVSWTRDNLVFVAAPAAEPVLLQVVQSPIDPDQPG